MHKRRSLARIAGSVSLVTLLVLSGCILAPIAPILDNYNRTRTVTVKAEYAGLKGASFAVVVSAGRGIESETPGITDEMLGRISFRLAQPEVGATGVVPPETVVKSLYEQPSWPAMTYGELAKDVLGGVQRLVLIELEDFRLTEPGNRYEWAGVASGRVMVIESDGVDPNQIVFEKFISVKFPDKQGFTPESIDSRTVASELLRRFVDRTSWLFYDHQEPFMREY
jgi:hypothetical protein